MIPFLKYTKLYLSISAAAVAVSLFSLFFWGFDYSVEFVGGTNLRYSVKPAPSREVVRKVLEQNGVKSAEVDIAPELVEIRTDPISQKQEEAIRAGLEKSAGAKVTVLLSETVGPSMSQDTVRKTLIATALGVVGILVYVAYAFRNMIFAFAAVAALFHDVLILIGSYSLISHFFGAELNTLFVTAALTTMSFSVHDTIVMYDQFRHYIKQHGVKNAARYADAAITETIVRSLNNSFTILFMLLALALLGGETIRFFVISLLVGTVVGTYSSPFVSMPLAVWLLERREKRKKA